MISTVTFRHSLFPCTELYHVLGLVPIQIEVQSRLDKYKWHLTNKEGTVFHIRMKSRLQSPI